MLTKIGRRLVCCTVAEGELVRALMNDTVEAVHRECADENCAGQYRPPRCMNENRRQRELQPHDGDA